MSIRQRLFNNLMSGHSQDTNDADLDHSRYQGQRCITHVSNPCDDLNQIVLLNVPTQITVASIEQSVCEKEVPPSRQLISMSHTALPSKQVTSRLSHKHDNSAIKPNSPLIGNRCLSTILD